MLKVGVPRFTRVPQLLVYNLKKMSVNIDGHLFIQKGQIISHSHIRQDHCASDPQWLYFQNTP